MVVGMVDRKGAYCTEGPGFSLTFVSVSGCSALCSASSKSAGLKLENE